MDDIPSAVEEWDTNQRLHAQVGGVPLRDDELRNLVMKVVLSVSREQLVFKLENLGGLE